MSIVNLTGRQAAWPETLWDLHGGSGLEHKTGRLVGSRLRQAISIRIALYCFLILITAFIGATEATKDESSDTVAKIADVIGLFAFSILSLQFILSSRLSRMERPFGHRLLHFHRRMGITVASC